MFSPDGWFSQRGSHLLNHGSMQDCSCHYILITLLAPSLSPGSRLALTIDCQLCHAWRHNKWHTGYAFHEYPVIYLFHCSCMTPYPPMGCYPPMEVHDESEKLIQELKGPVAVYTFDTVYGYLYSHILQATSSATLL